MISFGAKCDVKEIYGDILIELTEKENRVVVVEADLMKASGSTAFMEKYPEKHFNVGVAEQDLLGFAAGLAGMGKIPFASSFACFISQRACDQAINSIAYNKFNVKMIGSYAGLTSEKNGGTHISVEDLAIFRSMPNMIVSDPGDAVEFTKMLEFAVTHNGPMYIRENKGKLPVIFNDQYQVELGKSIVIREGTDFGLFTTGITTAEGIKACEALSKKGITVRHVHMPFIKPIDREEIIKTAKKTPRMVTVENHSIYGGLGSAVAEVLCEEYPARLTRMGLKDCFGETAKLAYLIKKFEIDAEAITKKIIKLTK